MFSRDIVLSLQRLPPGYRLVGAESVITVIGTAPRPVQEDELLPLATPGAPADRPRLRITTSSALRASLMIKDRVLTAPSGVRGGSCIERLRWGAVGRPSSLTLAQRPSPPTSYLSATVRFRPTAQVLLSPLFAQPLRPTTAGRNGFENVTLKIARGPLAQLGLDVGSSGNAQSNLNNGGSKLIIE